MGNPTEYHLIDLATGLSHGGFQSLEAARQYAREEGLMAWDSFAEMCAWNIMTRASGPRNSSSARPPVTRRC